MPIGLVGHIQKHSLVWLWPIWKQVSFVLRIESFLYIKLIIYIHFHSIPLPKLSFFSAWPCSWRSPMAPIAIPMAMDSPLALAPAPQGTATTGIPLATGYARVIRPPPYYAMSRPALIPKHRLALHGAPGNGILHANKRLLSALKLQINSKVMWPHKTKHNLLIINDMGSRRPDQHINIYIYIYVYPL